MGINGSQIDFNNPTNNYDIKGTNDPDNVGRLSLYRDQGYDTGYDTQPVTKHDEKTRGIKGPMATVQLYSKSNFNGTMFEIEYGNYTSDVFVPYLIPSNVFSLSIPPRTTVKIYCGDKYDFGGKGGMSITNTGSDVMRVSSLPPNISGHIRSISIISHAIDRRGEIKDVGDIETDLSDDGKDAVIITDRGDVIAAGLSVEQIPGQSDMGKSLEPFHNITYSQYSDRFIFYFCLIIIIYLIYNL